MKNILIILTLIVLLPSSFALELGSQEFPNENSTNQEFILSSLPKAGILPDSPFYFFKELKEKVQLLITLDKEKKIELKKHFDEVRLSESNKLLDKNRNTETIKIFKKNLEEYKQMANKNINTKIVLENISKNIIKENNIKIKEEVTKIENEVDEKKDEIDKLIEKTDEVIKDKKQESNSLDVKNKTKDSEKINKILKNNI